MSPKLLAAVAVVALATPAWGQGSPDTSVINMELSGYGLSLEADPAAPVRRLNVMEGKSNRGPVSGTALSPVFGSPSNDPPDWCSGTAVFLPFVVAGELGLRFQSSGDLLQLKSSVPDPALGLCYSYLTNQYEVRNAGVVIAGTGRFQGATGTFETRFTGGCLLPGCTDPMLALVQTSTVTLDK